MFTYTKQALIVWLIKKVQKFGPHRVTVSGKTYEISEDVFNPKYYYTSTFMARHIRVTHDDSVLDMGTGSGIQAITAGQTASHVIAVDINPEAIRYARRNARNNGLERIVTVLEGDLFAPLDPQNKFSVIIFTPPYLNGIPKTVFDYALFDSNKKLIRRFFREAKQYLKPDGYVQMIYSSLAAPDEAVSTAGKLGWNYSIIAREKTLTEEFFIYKFTLV